MGMIKLMEMVAAKPGITRQYFHDHWRHPHSSWGLLIKSVRAYTQCHRFDAEEFPVGQGRFEGTAEISFESVRDCEDLRVNPVYKKYMENDSPLFTDSANSVFVFTDEEVIQSAPSATEVEGSADFAWRLERRPVSVKLVQMIEQDGSQPWASDDDYDLGLRINAARHVRSRPHPVIHADGASALGFRELWWPTYTDFQAGIARDPQAFEMLLSRPAKGYVGLFNAERFPL
jgi:hypothetical protein